MRKMVIALMIAFLLFGANLFAADGDLIVNGNVGIGDTNPASPLTVGNGDLFQVNSAGDIIKIKNLTYAWPSTHALGVLTNNGSGTLSWTTAGDITGVTAGEGLSGGGTTGDVTVSLNAAQIDVANCTNGTGAGKIYWDTTNNRLACGTDQTGTVGVTSLSQGTGITLSPNPITATGTISADTAYLQRRNAGMSTSCSGANLSIKTIAADGTVTCETDDIGSGVGGSGTLNYLSKWTSGTTLGNSVIYDNGTNIGIGDTSPASMLTVGNGDLFQVSSTGDIIRIKGITYVWPTNNASGVLTNNGSGTLSWAAASGLPSGTSGQTLRHNGSNWVANSVLYNNGTNVGISTSTPADQLEIYDGSAALNAIRITGNRPMLRLNELDSTDTNYQIDLNAGTLRFQANNDAFGSSTTRMVIDQSGKVGIGTASPSAQLELSTNSAAKPGSNTWTVASDLRLKTNIQPYTKGLKEILQINPVSYQYNGNGGVGHSTICIGDPCIEQDVVNTVLLSKTFVGVIAQDIQAVVPETVSSHKGKINEDDKVETDILDFDSHSLTFILINAVKELSAQIDSLNRQIEDLKARVK